VYDLQLGTQGLYFEQAFMAYWLTLKRRATLKETS